MAHSKITLDFLKSNTLFMCLILLSLGIFYPVWKNLFLAWSSSDDYSQGFLIIPLSLYILWQKREDLKGATIKSNWFSLPLVLLTLLLYLLAQYAEIVTLAPLAMILFLGVGLFFLCGWQVVQICLFPLFLLLFMVPVPGQIYAALTIPLQLFVTKMTVFISSMLGVPILREGNVLHLPEHTLQVVQACSGLRSIMSLLTLGAVIGYFGLRSNRFRAILLFSAVPIAILTNIVRVLLMVIAFYYFDFDLAEGTIHTAFGVVIFGFSVVLFLLFRKALVLCKK